MNWLVLAELAAVKVAEVWDHGLIKGVKKGRLIPSRKERKIKKNSGRQKRDRHSSLSLSSFCGN